MGLTDVAMLAVERTFILMMQAEGEFSLSGMLDNSPESIEDDV